MAIRVKVWGQQLEFVQHVCDSSVGSCFQEGPDGYRDCHCKPFPSPPGIILCTISSPSMNTGSVVVYSVYDSAPGACFNEGPLCCCRLLRCTWGMRVFLRSGREFLRRLWGMLAKMGWVNTIGSEHLGLLWSAWSVQAFGEDREDVTLGPVRWAVRMYDYLRMSETCLARGTSSKMCLWLRKRIVESHSVISFAFSVSRQSDIHGLKILHDQRWHDF